MSGKIETVFRTPWFQIAAVEPGDETSGTTDPYYCIIRQNGVLCLVFDDAGRVILVDQYRPPLGRTTLEMPAGTVDDNETPDEAIAREILEETGFRCKALIQITPCRLMLNREDVVEYFYIGLGACRAESFTRKERGTVRVLERDRLRELVITHRFEQTVALGAMYVAEKQFGLDLLKDDIKTIAARLTSGR
jgi:ADP-ribose pyrophosphatase